MSAVVQDDPDHSRYEIRVDGEVAGVADYRRRDDRITFTHTEVDDAYEGQGLGSQLVRTVLDEARAAGLAVHPSCPFIADYIRQHPDDYLDLVPERAREGYGL